MDAVSKHAESVHRFWHPEPREAPAGCNPTEGVGESRDCRRRRVCLTYAVQMSWKAMSCASCSVREPVESEIGRTVDGGTASWPRFEQK